MALDARKLEEDEAKIDNLLHKICESARAIRDLNAYTIANKELTSLVEDIDPGFTKRIKKINILAETVLNLALLADDIDLEDERLTSELEVNIRDKLKVAIEQILAANVFKDKKH